MTWMEVERDEEEGGCGVITEQESYIFRIDLKILAKLLHSRGADHGLIFFLVLVEHLL